jgi:hypothetical protein
MGEIVLIQADSIPVVAGAWRSLDSDWIVIYPNGRKQRSFPDGFKACAFFVKQEIERYRGKV